MAGTGGTRRRRIVLAVSLVLIAGIGYGVLRVVLFATGKPTISVDYADEYNERVRPANYDPNADAAAGYREAFALLPAIPDGVNPIGHLWEYDPASEEYKTLESWLASCEEAVGLLHKAAAKPYFWGRVTSSDPNSPLSLDGFDFGMFTQAAHCLRYRTEYLAAHDNLVEASRCIATGLRMAGQLNNAGRESLVPGQIAGAETTLTWAIQAHYKSLASTEALIAIAGILRFHKDKGIWPASLEELAAAGYIRQVPMDPYSGKPLVYARAGGSFVLYSCGQDFHDNGGVRGNSGTGSRKPPAGEGDLVFWPVEGGKK